MFCRKCGKEIQDEAAFCFHCGSSVERSIRAESIIVPEKTPVPKPMVRQSAKRKKIPVSTLISSAFALVLAVALIISNTGMLSGAAAKNESESSDISDAADESETNLKNREVTFSTPEAAMEYFAESIQEKDTQAAFQAFAISEMAEGYNLEKMMDRMQSFNNYSFLTPTDDIMYIDLNESLLYGQCAQQFRSFLYSFLLPEKYLNGSFVSLNDNDLTAKEIVTKIEDISKFEDLTLVRTDLSSPELQKSEQHQKNISMTCACYGADDMAEYTVLYKMDGQYYAGGITLFEYDGSWKISYLNAALAGFTSIAIPTSKSEYEDMVEGTGDIQATDWSVTDSSGASETSGASATTAAAETTATATTAATETTAGN